MRSWSACSSFLNRFLSTLCLFLFLINVSAEAQSRLADDLPAFLPHRSLSLPAGYSFQVSSSLRAASDSLPKDKRSLPDPNDVLRRSLLIPGWGQITNKQAWKVPIVYGLLGGLTYYSIYLNKKYHDYRAAYYNLNPNITSDDQRFGPTPSYIPESANLESLREIRNAFRNRRDFVYISIGLAYGLNAIDAYVFAHMRSFDVSEDLSVRTAVQPAVMPNGNPGMTISLKLFNHSKAE